MNSTVLVKTYTEPDFNKKEILRYSGISGDGGEFLSIIDECVSECREQLVYKICYSEFPVVHNGDNINLTFMTTDSKDLMKNLENCNSIVVFAATIGIGIDRLITKYGKISPVKALALQAIGAERIESLCNVFNYEIKSHYEQAGIYTKPRFSPGYGDFSLYTQKDFFRTLDCYRKIGLTLNDSMLMSPSKSVTAIIGLSDCKAYDDKDSCKRCNKTDCKFRSIV